MIRKQFRKVKLHCGQVAEDGSTQKFPGRLEFLQICEYHYLQVVVERNGSDVVKAAKETQCARGAFYLLLKQHGISKPPGKGSGRPRLPDTPERIKDRERSAAGHPKLSTPRALLQTWLVGKRSEETNR